MRCGLWLCGLCECGLCECGLWLCGCASGSRAVGCAVDVPVRGHTQLQCRRQRDGVGVTSGRRRTFEQPPLLPNAPMQSTLGGGGVGGGGAGGGGHGGGGLGGGIEGGGGEYGGSGGGLGDCVTVDLAWSTL